MKIVVMGGSFNPPTLAHLKLLEGAVDAISADLGIFLPSSHGYVKKKMAKQGSKEEVLPEKVRFEMLCAMAKGNPRLTVDPLEFSAEGKRYTYESMLDLEEKYKGAELYFLAGNDKVEIFPRWWRIEEFLERFNIIVCRRDGMDPVDTINKNPFLYERKERFYVVDQPDGIDGISSTEVRRRLGDGDDSALEMCHPEAVAVMKRYKNAITRFREEYHFLSNFYPSPVTYGGITYLNAEAAFQAQKCTDPDEMYEFAELSGYAAKKKGRRVALREDWNCVRLGIMEEIVRAKFHQNQALAKMLVATGDRIIEEGNLWHDTFWGVDARTRKGENHLGVILMKIRREIANNFD